MGVGGHAVVLFYYLNSDPSQKSSSGVLFYLSGGAEAVPGYGSGGLDQGRGIIV